MKRAVWFLIWLATSVLFYRLGYRGATPAAPPTPTATGAAELSQMVTATPRLWQDTVVATGNLTADPDRQSQVGSPATGRITQVWAKVGDHVNPGQPLARLQSPEILKTAADYHHAEVRYQLAQKTLEQRRQVARLGDLSRRPVEEARNEYAAARSEFEMAGSALTVTRKRQSRNQDLYQHGISTQQQTEEDQAALEESQSRLEKARYQLEVAREHLAREERVAQSGSMVTTRILEAETEAALAREEMEHSRKLLENFGVHSLTGDSVDLRANRSGVVVQRAVSAGQWVSAEQELFLILDPSRLWLWLNLYEKDFPRVRVGMAVRLPDLKMRGRVSYLAPQLEQGSRTQLVRIEVDNPGNLRVGMFTRAEILVGPEHTSLALPKAAVQGDGWVYVRNQDGSFGARRVKLGLEDKVAGVREICSGLRSGEEVLGEGSYLLYQAGAR